MAILREIQMRPVKRQLICCGREMAGQKRDLLTYPFTFTYRCTQCTAIVQTTEEYPRVDLVETSVISEEDVHARVG